MLKNFGIFLLKLYQKYLSKGMKIGVRGELRTGSYENKKGDTVYTTEVIVSQHEFCDSKK